jgi:hypothetical protein
LIQRPLPASAVLHLGGCLGPIAVVNWKKETKRLVFPRGKVRITAYYFWSDADALAYKAQPEKMFIPNGSRVPSRNANSIEPSFVNVDVPIPCQAVDCTVTCNALPLILDGEYQIVPDIYDRKDWNERGQAINDQLARKSPCATAVPHHN